MKSRPTIKSKPRPTTTTPGPDRLEPAQEEVFWCVKHRSTAVQALGSMCEVADERFGSQVEIEDWCQFVPATLTYYYKHFRAWE